MHVYKYELILKYNIYIYIYTFATLHVCVYVKITHSCVIFTYTNVCSHIKMCTYVLNKQNHVCKYIYKYTHTYICVYITYH